MRPRPIKSGTYNHLNFEKMHIAKPGQQSEKQKLSQIITFAMFYQLLKKNNKMIEKRKMPIGFSLLQLILKKGLRGIKNRRGKAMIFNIIHHCM